MSGAGCPPWCDTEPGHGRGHSGAHIAVTPDLSTGVAIGAYWDSGAADEPTLMMFWRGIGNGVSLRAEDAAELAVMMDGLGRTDIADALRRGVELIGGAEVTS